MIHLKDNYISCAERAQVGCASKIIIYNILIHSATGITPTGWQQVGCLVFDAI